MRVSPFKALGPGLISGAADDDPSGIATYTQAGVQFGYSLLWTAALTLPFMIAIQFVSGRIGRVTGHSIAGNLRRHYSRRLLYAVVLLLLTANTINIAADIAAMGEALQLVAGGGEHGHALVFGVLLAVLQVFLSYARLAAIFKWLTLTLFAYVGVVFTVAVPWHEVIAGTLLPDITWSGGMLTTIVAVFGTTISPYLFFWQASQEVEEMRRKEKKPLINAPATAKNEFRRLKLDTVIGMTFSNLIAFFIMLTAAATLHLSGVRDIQTSAQAAEALRPIAGDFAFVLFAAGIIGTGLLAVPVLAGSAAYAMAEAFGWREGLDLKWFEARGFYAIIIGATIIGTLLDFTPIDPIKALYWSAVINGALAVPVMALMMLLASDPKVMGRFVLTRRGRYAGWLATAVMSAAVAAMFLAPA